MGRVSKYKKIKAIDPYSKQRKKSFSASSTMTGYGFGFGAGGEDMMRLKKLEKKAQKQERNNAKNKNKKKIGKPNTPFFDVPPDAKEDDFDMATLTVHKNENKANITSNSSISETKKDFFTASDSNGETTETLVLDNNDRTFERANQQLQQELKISRMLKINPQATSSSTNSNKLHGRLEGESMKAFTRRINLETAMILKHSMKSSSQNNGTISHLKQSNPTKYEKKVKFLNRKKKRAQHSFTEAEDEDDKPTSNEAILITGEVAVQQQQALAVSTSSNLLHDQVERPPSFSVLPRGAKLSNSSSSNNKAPAKGIKPAPSKLQAKELEQYRAKVQAQYALMKAKQRNAYLNL